jgi:hypothetical protein
MSTVRQQRESEGRETELSERTFPRSASETRVSWTSPWCLPFRQSPPMEICMSYAPSCAGPGRGTPLHSDAMPCATSCIDILDVSL